MASPERPDHDAHPEARTLGRIKRTIWAVLIPGGVLAATLLIVFRQDPPPIPKTFVDGCLTISKIADGNSVVTYLHRAHIHNAGDTSIRKFEATIRFQRTTDGTVTMSQGARTTDPNALEPKLKDTLANLLYTLKAPELPADAKVVSNFSAEQSLSAQAEVMAEGYQRSFDLGECS